MSTPSRSTSFLAPVPADSAWARLDEYQCTASASVPARCNWKTLIDAFSETYHVQGIHREMLPMCDDVYGPQGVWERHGRLIQPYGLASPRLRDRPDDQGVWEAFVEVMGNRVGLPTDKAAAGPAPTVPSGSTFREVLAERIRDRNRDLGIDMSDFDTDQMLNMSQYNLFPEHHGARVLGHGERDPVPARRRSRDGVHGCLLVRAATGGVRAQRCTPGGPGARGR